MTEIFDEIVLEPDELREHYSFDYSKAKPNRFMNDLPLELQNELVSLQNQNDKDLLIVAQESVSSEQWRRHEYLLSRNQDGSLTTAERAELTQLRTAVDHLVLRRSYALALLKRRGYAL